MLRKQGHGQIQVLETFEYKLSFESIKLVNFQINAFPNRKS